MNNLLKRTFVSFLQLFALTMFIFLSCATFLFAEESPKETLLQSTKIQSELKETIRSATLNQKIPVWIWMKPIDDKIIDQILTTEYQMNPSIYENEERFNAIIKPEIVQQVEAEKGVTAAHLSISNADADGKIITPIDIAVQNELKRYRETKLSTIKSQYSTQNNTFIDQFVRDDQENPILYNSDYSSTIIAELSASEITNVLSSPLVEEVSLYTEAVTEPTMDTALKQAGVYCEGGSGYDIPDGRLGFSGLGTKIGILETAGGYLGAKYDSSAPLLSTNNKIHFVENTLNGSTPVNYEVTDHATIVTSIIAGKVTIYNSKIYKGVAAGAEVYQTPTATMSDALTGFQVLVNNGVDVINASIGSDTLDDYSYYDKEIDRLIANTGVAFVVGAGNEGETTGYVTSPAKALNAITVGNAKTKLSGSYQLGTPYSINSKSSYAEINYLPNKPDIVAPGTNINCLIKNNYLSCNSGTSLSAPVVTGIISQMIQAQYSLRGKPTEMKAVLLYGAEPSKVTTNNNNEVGSYLRDKSGAGFVNAIKSVEGAYGCTKFTKIISSETNTPEFYGTAGQKIRAVLVFDIRNNAEISSLSNIDDIDIHLRNSQNTDLAQSRSSRNNVEIIEYTLSENGYYHFCIKPYRIADQTKPPKISVAYKISQ